MKILKVILICLLPVFAMSQQQPSFVAALYKTTVELNGTNLDFTRNNQKTTVPKVDLGVILFQTGAIVYNINASPQSSVYFQGLYDDLLIAGQTTTTDKQAWLLSNSFSRASGGGGGGGTGDASAARGNYGLNVFKIG